MKLSEIKTPTQFWDLSDMWWERTKKLKDVFIKADIPHAKRLKAYKLFMEMWQRMVTLKEIATKLTHYHTGGMVGGTISGILYGNIFTSEYIITTTNKPIDWDSFKKKGKVHSINVDIYDLKLPYNLTT